MKIRKATLKDIKEITKIFRIESAKQPYNEKWEEKTALQKMKEYVKLKNDIYVAEKNREVVGFMILKNNLTGSGAKIYLDQLFVNSKSQGLGIGSDLINYAVKYCKKKKRVALCLVSSNKSKAFKFYKKRKFIQMEKDFIYMEKKIR